MPSLTTVNIRVTGIKLSCSFVMEYQQVNFAKVFFTPDEVYMFDIIVLALTPDITKFIDVTLTNEI